MLAVGHISVAYLLTRGLKRIGWPSMNIPLVWAFSLLPDLDLLTAKEAAGSPILMGGMPTITIPPLPPILSNLTIMQDEVEEGEDATFSVNVTNIGETEGSYTVEFKVDGETIETEIVTLARGESTTVSFEETWSAGTYQVNVEDLTETFIVSKKPIKPFWTRLEIIAGAIIAATTIIYALRRRQVVTEEVRSW